MLPAKETRIFQKLSLVISSHKGEEFQIAANDDEALLLLNENRGGGWGPGMSRTPAGVHRWPEIY